MQSFVVSVYHSGDKIKDEMDGSCSMYGREEKW